MIEMIITQIPNPNKRSRDLEASSGRTFSSFAIVDKIARAQISRLEPKKNVTNRARVVNGSVLVRFIYTPKVFVY
ncbi:hypothetical protein HanLR1_Chr17g0676761 [Helianthus annuus]|nr:hypothetical protein HanHA89_Chr17g0718311 [Helianthus annuus]KAJ0633432.1 hypothetical protein HanLR1_Chr17g0676761 [Helianthus annuus]